jgi:hypothetical protein
MGVVLGDVVQTEVQGNRVMRVVRARAFNESGAERVAKATGRAQGLSDIVIEDVELEEQKSLPQRDVFAVQISSAR